MEATLVVLPTSRSIREFYLASADSSFLTQTITIASLFEKTLYVPEKKLIDEDMRNVLLLKASDFRAFSKLQIERNFFSFLNNSSYIFGFFEELNNEKVTLSDLASYDFYLEYEEHIAILRKLYDRYVKLLDEYNLYDAITLAKEYKIFDGYIRQFSKIKLYATGIFSRFELEILEKIAIITPLEIIFQTSKYNKKARERIEEKIGKQLVDNAKITIDFTNKTILSIEAIKQNKKIDFIPLPNRVLQAGFVFETIDKFIQHGIRPEKIVVITPDEKFCEILELFDKKRNCNFAMGKSFTQTFVYKKVAATLEAFVEDTKEVELTLERVGNDFFEFLIPYRKNKCSQEDLETILKYILTMAKTKEEKNILEEEITKYIKLYEYIQEFTLDTILELFLNRIAKRKLHDIGGGKITVMGVLETRCMRYDGVIVVDFNEGIVPKRSNKDIFFNSIMRQKVGLPSSVDRENLQKDYYYKLFQKAKYVAISATQTSTTMPSKFLKELDHVALKEYDSYYLSTILFDVHKKEKFIFDEREIAFDFKKIKLSATMLEQYLSCKRAFYYRYVMGILEAKMPTNLPQEWEVGRYIHNVLKLLYQKKQTYHDIDELQSEFEKIFKEILSNNVMHSFWFSLYKKNILPFFQSEIKRFQKGAKVLHCEIPLEVEYNGLKLYGICDRIDSINNALEIIDYKTGSYKTYNKNNYKDATSFQLEFYFLLASSLGEVSGCYFYDLQQGLLIKEPFFDEKIALLQEHLKELSQVQYFLPTQTDDTKRCEYCAYKIMCGR